MQEKYHGALPLLSGQTEKERSASDRFTGVIQNPSHGPICPCGFPLRLGSVDSPEGEYWWCSRCGEGPFQFPHGTHTEPFACQLSADLDAVRREGQRFKAELEKGSNGRYGELAQVVRELKALREGRERLDGSVLRVVNF